MRARRQDAEAKRQALAERTAEDQVFFQIRATFDISREELATLLHKSPREIEELHWSRMLGTTIYQRDQKKDVLVLAPDQTIELTVLTRWAGTKSIHSSDFLKSVGEPPDV